MVIYDIYTEEMVVSRTYTPTAAAHQVSIEMRYGNPSAEDFCKCPSECFLVWSRLPTRRTLAYYTPLHQAALNGRTATCALLLDRGADPNAKTGVCSVFLGSQSVSPACHCCEGGPSVFPDAAHWPASLLSSGPPYVDSLQVLSVDMF